MTEETVNQSWVRNIIGLLWRILLIGLGYTPATMLGETLAQALGLPRRSLNAYLPLCDQVKAIKGQNGSPTGPSGCRRKGWDWPKGKRNMGESISLQCLWSAPKNQSNWERHRNWTVAQ